MHARRPRGRRIAALLVWAWLGQAATAAALEIDSSDLAPEDIAPTQVLVVIGINLVLGFLLPNIAWQAHVGGLVVGAGVAAIYMATRNRDRAWVRRAALAGITVVLAIVLVVAVMALR